ncbi:MAG TPA: UDP-glucose 4-epimerase GalE [Sinomonas sp.]|nr:UDP-glucose 4-epimerase GalE [Sinomonas sp.]
MQILVTGGAGYIGSHTALALLNSGYDVTVVDNFSNSVPEAICRVSELAGRRLQVIEADLADPQTVKRALAATRPDAVIHFAGLKSVGESHSQPLRYFSNNLSGTLNLLSAMHETDIRRLIFSSSATVYGVPDEVPVTEDHSLSTTNPYGRTKLVGEQMLTDIAASDVRWSFAILRYFNPVGSHPSGRIGEDPRGTPSNLVPYVGHVAVGREPLVNIFGGDYPTPDGTGVRDYIHVEDLAAGHLAALVWVQQNSGIGVWNLGTGRGYSVLEVIRMYEQVSGQRIPRRIVARRQGDVSSSYADPAKAERELGWSARRGLREMIEDHWRWQSRNPMGYEGEGGP